jgi:type I restriction enzyme R subunit
MVFSREKNLQLDICEYLATHNWLWTPPTNLLAVRDRAGSLQATDSKGYNRELALFPADVFGYIADTQPEEWGKLFPETISDEKRELTQMVLLKHIAQMMDKKYSRGGGVVNMFSRPFKFSYQGVNVTLSLAQLAPETSANRKLVKAYEATRFRVIHELKYSEHKEDRIDLVFFINGVPIATMELKNGITETYQNAVTQYQEHRTPYAKTATGQKIPGRLEPLLNGRRAVAHFAVDPDNVYMATWLNGSQTVFLPFNAGGDADDPSKNKENGHNPRTAYLWEDIFHTHSLMNILRSFLIQSTKDAGSQKTRKNTVEEIIFPRYHQWFGATLALAVTLREDVGAASLLMWSAGSGKSNGIAWLAHGLNNLNYDSIPYAFENLSPRMQAEVLKFVPEKKHGKTTGPLFTGGGFVITDRTNLDSQLGATVQMKNSVEGTVVHIGKGRGRDSASKTAHLATEMRKAGSSIKIITLQTFPFALQAIEQAQAEADTQGVARAARQTFFVIRDEAHASEGGKGTQSLLELLNASTYSQALTHEDKQNYRDLIDAGSIDEVELLDALTDLQLKAKQQSKADRTSVSYFAFTATPKPRTLEMFGRKNPESKGSDALTEEMIPLHTYSMEQAIKEGFILDVMRNYFTYELKYQLVATTEAGVREVEANEGKKALLSWVHRQPETLGQKAAVIVDHFATQVFRSLPDGKAQAMLFASSRADALLYKKALDAQIKSHGYNIRTLVAFSGSLVDPDTNEEVTEGSVNGTGSRSIATVFEKEPYHILIVANKYQTGYDNPRLVGGYIDKKLKGMEAVQALSRFNRIAPQFGKSEVYLLDFANDSKDIAEAFNQYYRTLSLESKSDPNMLHELQGQIEAYDLYQKSEMNAWVKAWMVNHTSAYSTVTLNIRGRYNTMKEQAERDENLTSQKYYAAYLPLLKQYVEVYGFQSTIVDYGDTEVEKQALFYTDLYTALSTTSFGSGGGITLDGVGILSTSLRRRTADPIIFDPVTPLQPEAIAEIAGKTPTTPEMVRLQVLINYVNELFSNLQGVSENDQASFTNHVLNKMLEDKSFVNKARSNTSDKLATSGHTEKLFNSIVWEAIKSYEKMATYVHTEDIAAELMKLIVPVAWDAVNNPKLSPSEEQ